MKKDEKGMKKEENMKKNEKVPRHSQKGRKIFNDYPHASDNHT